MKKLFILLLATILLCGCVGKQGEEPTPDDSASQLETKATDSETADPPVPRDPTHRLLFPYGKINRGTFTQLNAVAVTWGDPVPEDDASYDEIYVAGDTSTYIPVRVTYDEVFYPSFYEYHHPYPDEPPDFPDSAIDGHPNHYIFVSKDVIDQFPAGKKQLIFLDYWNGWETTQKTYYLDTPRKLSETGFQNYYMRPIFDIVDGRIIFPDDYEEYILHPLDRTRKYIFSLSVEDANLRLKRDYPDLPVFEDGMLISDFGPYIDRILSYETTTCIK